MLHPKVYFPTCLCGSKVDKGIHNFPKSISPKGDIITQMEFELAYYDVAVQYVSHYITATPLNILTTNNFKYENVNKSIMMGGERFPGSVSPISSPNLLSFIFFNNFLQ